MRIAFCTPFKPLNHSRTSGDVTIARDLAAYLESRGHELLIPVDFETSEVWLRPGRWPVLARAAWLGTRRAKRFGADVWLSYHTFWKAPDILGPLARRAGIPYAIFAASYATKHRRRVRSWPGFRLNRHALLCADRIFSNKCEDTENLRRIVHEDRLTEVLPGIRTAAFAPDPKGRARFRAEWAVERGGADVPVVTSVAMMRPGVKVQGLEWVIRTCGRLRRSGQELFLAVAGDGPGRSELESLAEKELPGRHVFAGRLEYESLRAFYSAGDVFAFPGINEGLGMVYLEAQCCGLPAVAFDHDGAPEVIRHGETGLITPSFDEDAFAGALGSLLGDSSLRARMGRAAREHVRSRHDLEQNYTLVEEQLLHLAGRTRI